MAQSPGPDDGSKKSEKVSPRKDFIGGYLGGMGIVVSGHPLDTIKVRLQTMKTAAGESPLYKNTWDCGVKTVRNEGIRGLYKGMGVPLLIIPPMFALWFFGFGVGKKLQQKHPEEQLSYFQIFKAGMLAGTIATVLCSPGERIKCLLQIQAESKEKAKYKGPADCIRQLYKEGGIRWIYRGTAATFLRDIHGSGVYFATYEVLQRSLTPEGESRNDLSPLRTLLAGGIAGLANWLVAIPPDVIKTRVQTAPMTGESQKIAHVVQRLLKNEGYKALYIGSTPLLMRAFIGNAACLLSYEATIRILNYFVPNL